MESIIEYLQRKLKDAGPSRWPEIAAATTKPDDKRPITFHTLRKIAYGERPNLGSVVADRLRVYFETEKRPTARKAEKV